MKKVENKGCGKLMKYKYSNTPQGEIKEGIIGHCGDKKGFPNKEWKERILCDKCKNKLKRKIN